VQDSGCWVKTLFKLLLEFSIGDTFPCPFYINVLGLVFGCVFVFGEHIYDVAGWVVSVSASVVVRHMVSMYGGSGVVVCSMLRRRFICGKRVKVGGRIKGGEHWDQRGKEGCARVVALTCGVCAGFGGSGFELYLVVQ
jgi:hypothetical protein